MGEASSGASPPWDLECVFADVEDYSQVSPEERREINAAGTGTHMSTWAAAGAFASWLQKHPEELQCQVDRKTTVLELGSGEGWFGLTLARNVPGLCLTMSEIPYAVPRLSNIVSRCAQRGLLHHEPAVIPLDWTDTMPPVVDLVIGSDLCWNRETSDALATVLGKAVKQSKVLYAHWNRSERFLKYLLGALKGRGVKVVVAHPMDWQPGTRDIHLPNRVDTKQEPRERSSAEPQDPYAHEVIDGEWDYTAALFHDEQPMHTLPPFFIFECTPVDASRDQGPGLSKAS